MNQYPWIEKLGMKIEPGPPSYVKFSSIDAALNRAQRKQFGALFGVQTCIEDGAFPSDVEAVLVRMFEGRRTGTQLEWD